LVVFSRRCITKTLLKKRFFKKPILSKLRYGTYGLYCEQQFRFEYRYKFFLRKFFKRFIKRRRRRVRSYFRRCVWLFIRPNYVLTHKSKNARMGKGKGNFKRWCTIVYPGRVFIEHLNASARVYIKYRNKMRKKMKLCFKIKTQTSRRLKNPQPNYDIKFTSALTFIKSRKALQKTHQLFSNTHCNI